MTEPDITSAPSPQFMVLGLMGRNRGKITVIEAEDETSARRQYHNAFPGWEGTIFQVKPVTDDEEEETDV